MTFDTQARGIWRHQGGYTYITLRCGNAKYFGNVRYIESCIYKATTLLDGSIYYLLNNWHKTYMYRNINASNAAGATIYKYLDQQCDFGLDIQIKYGSPYCVTCPTMSTGPRSLKPSTRRRRYVLGGGIPGSVRILGQVTQFCKTCLICIKAQVIIVQLLAFCVRGRSGIAAEALACDQEHRTPPATTPTSTTTASDDTNRRMGTKPRFKNFC